jgi:TrmH family RNA methyltransferase
MLSKSQISFIKSLHQKKYRKESGLFLVEGMKSITEFLNSQYSVQSIYCLAAHIPKLPKLSQKQKVFEVSEQDLTKISTLKTPQEALAILEIPKEDDFTRLKAKQELVFVLDGVQDPGNLGTIIRTLDWFGFDKIICSPDTVEVYNPKVVQATMGSLARVKVAYADLKELLSEEKLPIYGTLLAGKNIFEVKWPSSGYVILGSEGNGISKEIKALVTEAVTIPGAGHTESLNVAISAAICCTEIKRINYIKN